MVTASRLVAAALVVSAVLVPVGPATAQQASPAGVVTAVQGQSVAVRTGLPRPVPLKFKDEVFLQDRIETGDESLARILLGGKALVTVRERSVLTITEVPGKATVDLARGRAAISLGKSLLKPGESVEIRTPSAIAAVRGSTVLVQFEGPSGNNFWATLHVSKPVEIALLGGATTSLNSDQIVTVTTVNGRPGFGPIGPVPPGLAQWAQFPLLHGSQAAVPDHVVEKWQSAANQESQEDGLPGWTSAPPLGVFNNPCSYASCAGPPGPPSGPPTTPVGSPPPFTPSTQPVVVLPFTAPGGGGPPPGGGGPPPGLPPGPPPGGGGPPSPPPVVGGPSFTQPSISGIKPNTPGHPTNNFLPNNGGIPPGLQNKGGLPPGRNK